MCAPKPAVGMPGLVSLEFAKARRRRLWLSCLGLLAFQFAWLVAASARYVEKTPDFDAVLYTLPQLDAVVLPLLCAVVASTVTDVEARSNTWKLLLTLEDAGRLHTAKHAACLAVVGVAALAQTLGVALVAPALGFTQNLPGAAALARSFVTTFAVCAMLVTILQAACLAASSQFAPMVAGVVLCFLGLFVAYLPDAFTWLVPSAYFFVVRPIDAVWDAAAQAMAFSPAPFPWDGLVVCIALCALVSLASRRAFARKEL